MTVKEICELTKRGKSTVYRWIESASQNGNINSQNGNYTLDETVEIIRNGGNETLANLLKQNAEDSNNGKNIPESGKEYLTIKDIPEIVKETVKALMPMLRELVRQPETKQIEYKPEPKKVITEMKQLSRKENNIITAALNNNLKGQEKRIRVENVSLYLDFND